MPKSNIEKAKDMFNVLKRAPLYDLESILSEKARSGDTHGIIEIVVRSIAKASHEDGTARQLRNHLEKESKETFETVLPELWKIFLQEI